MTKLNNGQSAEIQDKYVDQIQADLKARYIKRLHWLNTMRWFAAGAVSLALFLSAAVRIGLPLAQLTAGLTALIAANLIYSNTTGNLTPHRSTIGSVFRLFYIEVFWDFMILTWLIHFSGGITNLFAFCFAFHIVIASVMVPSLINYGLAAGATLLMSLMAVSEFKGWIGHYSLNMFAIATPRDNPLELFHMLAAFAAVMFITAYIASALGSMLKRREEYLSRLTDEMRTHNEEMRRANERLIEIDRTKTDFMRMAAHEIRSPVSALLSIMNTIIEGYVTDMEQIVTMLKMGSVRASDALRLSRDLLDLAREKSKDIAPENLDVNREILGAVSAIEPAARLKDIVINADLPAHPIRSVFDRDSFVLVLNNLLENAVNYSPEHAGPVTVSLQNANQKITLSVSDHGIGIPEEDRDRIFHEFNRAGNAREYSHAGTGLGLTIAKRAAQNLGGRLDFTSRIGEGTEFTLTWPLLE